MCKITTNYGYVTARIQFIFNTKLLFGTMMPPCTYLHKGNSLPANVNKNIAKVGRMWKKKRIFVFYNKYI